MSSSWQPYRNVLASSTSPSRQQPAESCGSEVRPSEVQESRTSLSSENSTLGCRVGAMRAKGSGRACRRSLGAPEAPGPHLRALQVQTHGFLTQPCSSASAESFAKLPENTALFRGRAPQLPS